MSKRVTTYYMYNNQSQDSTNKTKCQKFVKNGLYIFSYDILDCTYSHLIFYVVHILIFTHNILGCVYSSINFEVYIFSSDILGCTYSQITFWVVHFFFRLHFGLYILSEDILGCTYSHMTFWVVHFFQITCWVVHMRICTTQNVIWEYVQPKYHVRIWKYVQAKCHMKICTALYLLWKSVQPNISYENIYNPICHITPAGIQPGFWDH